MKFVSFECVTTEKGFDIIFFSTLNFSSIQTALRDPLVVVNARPEQPPPFFINKCKLLPKWITVDSNASSISSVDEKPGAASSSTLASEEEVIITESQAVDESVIEEARKEAEQGTLPPTKKEFPTEWMATILKERLQNARTRVINLTETERFQRATERQLVEIGTNRFELNSLIYLNEVCPRLLEFAMLDLKVETFKVRRLLFLQFLFMYSVVLIN